MSHPVVWLINAKDILKWTVEVMKAFVEMHLRFRGFLQLVLSSYQKQHWKRETLLDLVRCQPKVQEVSKGALRENGLNSWNDHQTQATPRQLKDTYP